MRTAESAVSSWRGHGGGSGHRDAELVTSLGVGGVAGIITARAVGEVELQLAALVHEHRPLGRRQAREVDGLRVVLTDHHMVETVGSGERGRGREGENARDGEWAR